jgi:glycosidase
MNKINAALLADFPTLSIFGEAWANTVTGSAYFTENHMAVAFKHNLPGTTDFPMQSAMLSAINQSFGWTEGVNKLMMTLAQDVLYKDPKRNCIFLDNHDVDRYLTMIGGDLNKWKMGIGLLLTLRGIPQLYYGTEVLLQNDPVNGDGKKRNDFPGGFAGDAANKFTAAGRSTTENEAFTFVSKLANFRKHSKALTVGTTTQYLPQDGVFVFARQHKGETVLVVLNQNNAPAVVDASRFRETLQNYQMATEVYSGAQLPIQNKWNVPAQTIWVLSLK